MTNDDLRRYVATALWSSTDADGESMDKRFTINDIAPSARRKMREDCETFLGVPHVQAYLETEGYHNIGRVLHDFWLTRNRHGAGFWDGDYPEPWGTRLTDTAHAFGGCDLYADDDGIVRIN